MIWQFLWFVLAGFVLGFTASTLWEWYFYRRERMRLIDEQIAALNREYAGHDHARHDHTGYDDRETEGAWVDDTGDDDLGLEDPWHEDPWHDDAGTDENRNQYTPADPRTVDDAEASTFVQAEPPEPPVTTFDPPSEPEDTVPDLDVRVQAASVDHEDAVALEEELSWERPVHPVPDPVPAAGTALYIADSRSLEPDEGADVSTFTADEQILHVDADDLGHDPDEAQPPDADETEAEIEESRASAPQTLDDRAVRVVVRPSARPRDTADDLPGLWGDQERTDQMPAARVRISPSDSPDVDSAPEELHENVLTDENRSAGQQPEPPDAAPAADAPLSPDPEPLPASSPEPIRSAFIVGLEGDTVPPSPSDTAENALSAAYESTPVDQPVDADGESDAEINAGTDPKDDDPVDEQVDDQAEEHAEEHAVEQAVRESDDAGAQPDIVEPAAPAAYDPIAYDDILAETAVHDNTSPTIGAHPNPVARGPEDHDRASGVAGAEDDALPRDETPDLTLDDIPHAAPDETPDETPDEVPDEAPDGAPDVEETAVLTVDHIAASIDDRTMGAGHRTELGRLAAQIRAGTLSSAEVASPGEAASLTEDVEEEEPRLSAVRTGPVFPPAAPAPEEEPATVEPVDTAASPDNLSQIKGIGKIYCGRLYAAGIFTWHQLANTSVAELRRIVDPPVSANIDDWPVQAEKLAVKYGRVGATYTGPVPDDLSRIRGIGRVGKSSLYAAGIYTFRDLAAALPETLAQIIPSSPNGEEIDYVRWLKEARGLADTGDDA